MQRRTECGTGADIDLKVAFLASPKAYAERPKRVETIETHYSWVFLTDHYVYKLKKPLRGDDFDFSTPEARRRNAQAELRLNRRLALDVYLAVVPLTRERGCKLAIDGHGAAIDWLVRMVRLPVEHMLDRRLAERDWHHADIQMLAACLAKFYANARRVRAEPGPYLARFHAECRSSREVFRIYASPALEHIGKHIIRCIETFIARRNDLLLQRLEDRRIVEGHGDLRPEHICLVSTPRIIDCLEFRADLRALDPVDELAFLAMECERLGVRSIGPVLFNCYRQRTGDNPPAVLIAFYKAIGALVRARIALLHLREKPVRDPKKWPKRAAEYLEIARRQCRLLGR
jgi:aminoglycoside phosphotransferase family enzyme